MKFSQYNKDKYKLKFIIFVNLYNKILFIIHYVIIIHMFFFHRNIIILLKYFQINIYLQIYIFFQKKSRNIHLITFRI